MYEEIKEKIINLNSNDRQSLFLFLLLSENIDYVELSKAYTKALKIMNEQKEIEKRLLADCLSGQYCNLDDMEFIHARSGILLQKYFPKEFIKKYIIKNVSKKEIEKEKKFIKEELNGDSKICR